MAVFFAKHNGEVSTSASYQKHASIAHNTCQELSAKREPIAAMAPREEGELGARNLASAKDAESQNQGQGHTEHSVMGRIRTRREGRPAHQVPAQTRLHGREPVTAVHPLRGAPRNCF